MAQIESLTYTHAELTALMLKERGIHEGFWQLLVSFNFGAANVGPDAENLHPSAFVQVAAVGLSRAQGPGPLVVDAAEVNPAK